MASMKDLLKHAQKTREAVVDPAQAAPLPAGYEVPKCVTCGAPREAQEGAARGAHALPCRFCGTR